MAKKKRNIIKGNPNQITVRQHIIPQKSIKRFYNANSCVKVRLVKQQKTISVNSSNKIFCAMGCWDHNTENYMTSIENNFQILCDKIIKSGIEFKIQEQENSIITEYFALWHSRYYCNKNPESNWRLKGLPTVDKGNDFTQYEKENLEKLGAIMLDADIDGVYIPSHIANGQIIRNSIINFQILQKNARWGILIAEEEKEFIMPDFSAKLMAIPITPKICLFSYEENQYIADAEVKKINSYAITFSQNYFFARDFMCCS
ncbi:MAG: hypothetical protein ACI9TO_001331 [Rickettsiales bacterium]|jgi:hypothetical protein